MPTAVATKTAERQAARPGDRKRYPGMDAKIEAWLEERGVTDWVYLTNIDPVEDIDAERSLANQARLNMPLNPETVERYTVALRNGVVFPGVVGQKRRGSKGKYTLADGNHRRKCYEDAGLLLPGIYEINVSASLFTRLTFEANIPHGMPTGSEERLHHAVHLIDAGMTAPDAAALMQLKVTTVQGARRKVEANRRAVDVGIAVRDWEAIHGFNQGRLGAIYTDEGFGAAVRLVRAAGITNKDDVDSLVVAMNKAGKSAVKQVAVVDLFRQEWNERIREGDVGPRRGRQDRTPRTALGTTVGFASILPAPEIFADVYQPEERAEMLEKVEGAIERLNRIAEVLAKK